MKIETEITKKETIQLEYYSRLLYDPEIREKERFWGQFNTKEEASEYDYLGGHVVRVKEVKEWELA